MSQYEVEQPILNSPYEEPAEHWLLDEGRPPRRVAGRRRAIYHYRDPKAKLADGQSGVTGVPLDLTLVNHVRERLKTWRDAGYPGVTRTTLELLQWWRRDGRERRLFFAQVEAAETLIFLVEGR